MQTLLTETETSRVDGSLGVDASRAAIVAAATACGMMDERDYAHVERNTFRGNLVRALKQGTYFRGSALHRSDSQLNDFVVRTAIPA